MQLRSVMRRIGRVIGDAGLTIGISGGLTHGRGGGGKTHLDARAALFDEGARGYDARAPEAGLLNRVPGWLLIAALAAVFLVVVFFTSWT